MIRIALAMIGGGAFGFILGGALWLVAGALIAAIFAI